MIEVKRSRGRPTREEADRKLEHLLKVATDIFIERGYSAATMDGIAAAAGVGKHTLYSRYPDKKALFAGVVERLAARHVLPDFPDDDSLPFEEGLRLYARAIVLSTLWPEHLALYTLGMREGPRFPELPDILRRGARVQYIDALEAYFESHMKSGVIPRVDVLFLNKIFFTLIFGELNRSLTMQDPIPKPEEIDAYITKVVRIFLHGVTALPATKA